MTDGNGDASFSVLFNGQVGANQVVTSTATGDGNTSEFSGAASVAILPATDLAVSSTATPDPVGVGNDMTISVTIDNGGPGDANGVVATATLPAGSTFVSSPDGFTPNSSGQLVANVGSIAAGGSTTVSYVIRPAFVGSFAASVTVDNDEIDPVVANNIASASFDVEPNSGQSVFAFSAASYDIGEPGGSLTVTVTRSNGTAAASVQYATSAGTATPDADYLPTAATLNFAEGELSKSFEVPIINDLLIEGTETIGLVLSDPTNGAVLGQPFNAVVNILDDDPTPPPTGQFRLGATTFTFVEGTPFATIPVERVGGVEGEARVHFRTVDGTAKAGSDYTPFDFELIFSAGDNAPKLVLVPLIDDAIPENPESFSVSLSNATGAPIGSPSTATVTIDDDDPFPIPPDQQTISLGAAQYSVAENVSQAAIIVQRSSGSGVVSVRVRTADAAGAANTRYLPVDTVVTFEDGELLKTVPVVLINNTVADGNVDVAVTLSDPTGGPALGDPSVTVLTIVDDDTDGTPPPAASSTIQFAARTTTVDESAGLASLTLTRSGNLTSQVTLTIVPRAGDAQAGVDYDVTPISVVFAAGQSSATISVPIIDDTIADGDRAFGLFITDVVDAGGVTVNLGTIDSAIVVVQDNDAVSPGVPGGPTVVNVFFVGPTSAPSGIGITLSEPLMTAPDAGAFAIVSSGRDQRFGTADDRVIAISSVGYDALANQVVLATSTPAAARPDLPAGGRRRHRPGAPRPGRGPAGRRRRRPLRRLLPRGPEPGELPPLPRRRRRPGPLAPPGRSAGRHQADRREPRDCPGRPVVAESGGPARRRPAPAARQQRDYHHRPARRDRPFRRHQGPADDPAVPDRFGHPVGGRRLVRVAPGRRGRPPDLRHFGPSPRSEPIGWAATSHRRMRVAARSRRGPLEFSADRLDSTLTPFPDSIPSRPCGPAPEIGGVNH